MRKQTSAMALSNSSGVRRCRTNIFRSRWVQPRSTVADAGGPGQRAQATAVLQNALRSYGNTSIRARLQKNLNLLSFEGKAAPALHTDQFWDRKRPCLRSLRFARAAFFLAHWCVTAKRSPSLRIAL